MSELAPEYVRELLARFSLEAAFVGILLVLAYLRFGWSKVFDRLGGRRRVATLSFVAALAVVQLVDRWQYQFPPPASFYPLARFAMYQTGTIDEAGILTYRFTTPDDGGEREIDITERFQAVGLPSLNTRFRIISERLLAEDLDGRVWAEDQVRLYAIGIRSQAQANGEAVPGVIRFEVWRYPVGTTGPEGGELLIQVDIDPAGGGS